MNRKVNGRRMITKSKMIDLMKLVEIEYRPNVDKNKPGIYFWEIESIGYYIGKYKNKNRPLREYARNIRNMHNGKSYHNPSDYRRIHYALYNAAVEGRQIKLIFFENCEGAFQLERERQLIKEFGTLNGKAKLSRNE